MSQRQNSLRIKAVYDALEELQDSVIFVGELRFRYTYSKINACEYHNLIIYKL